MVERKTDSMKPKKRFVLLWSCLAVLSAGAVFASHGAPSSTERDAWINDRVDALVAAGWVKPLDRPVQELTNLQVAQLTADALATAPEPPDMDVPAPPSDLEEPSVAPAEKKVEKAEAVAEPTPEPASTTTPPATSVATPAPSSPATSAARGLQELKREFSAELSAFGDDLARIEDRLEEARKRDRSFKEIVKEGLRKSGTQISGKGRFYVANYRSMGVSTTVPTSAGPVSANAAYGASDWNNILLADIRLKSAPVPAILFDATFRATRTLGVPYGDPLSDAAKLTTRWLALTCAGKPGSLTVGDFWKSYTPLTLWNYDIPVYTLLEPTNFKRIRKGLEEYAFLDHGNDWRMRGIDASTEHSWDGTAPFRSIKIQVMGGLLQTASSTQYAQEYGGTQCRLGFFEESLALKASGLVLQDDPFTTTMPYSTSDPVSWARRQAVGSFSAEAAVTVREEWTLTGDAEYARSRFQDDRYLSDTVWRDWAVRSGGSAQWKEAKLGVRYLNVGPDFFSPGAQTNRYTPAVNTPGYISSPLNLEDGLPGYRNVYVLQGFGRPAFAPYDRLEELFLPYGDATPNRVGFLVNGSAKVGLDGWIQPKVAAALGAKEFQPNYVRTGTADYVLPVDSNVNTGVARKFQSLEVAVVFDFAKVVEALPGNCNLGVDFKHQTSDAGLDSGVFRVDTLIASAEVGPIKRIPLIGGMVLSAAYERVMSRGVEYVLAGGAGLPPTTQSRYVPTFGGAPVSFQGERLDIDRSTMVVGFRYPVTKTFQIYGDWLMRKDVGKDNPVFDRREQIWKITHELTF